MTLENARALRKNATDCERLLWFHLRAHRLQGFKFKRQQPIGVYIVDFVCFETRCIVEADGGHHAERIDYDSRRDDWLRSQGFTVLRFWNNDILANIEGVLETIAGACRQGLNAPSPQPLPRQGGGAIKPAGANGPVAAASAGVYDGNNTEGEGNAPNLSREAVHSPLPSRDDCMDAGGRTTSGTDVERGRGRGGNER